MKEIKPVFISTSSVSLSTTDNAVNITNPLSSLIVDKLLRQARNPSIGYLKVSDELIRRSNWNIGQSK